MNMWKVLGVVVIAVVEGCYRPSFSDCRVACGAHDQCPPGLTCRSGMCASAGQMCDTSADKESPGDADAHADLTTDRPDGMDAGAAAAVEADGREGRDRDADAGNGPFDLSDARDLTADVTDAAAADLSDAPAGGLTDAPASDLTDTPPAGDHTDAPAGDLIDAPVDAVAGDLDRFRIDAIYRS